MPHMLKLKKKHAIYKKNPYLLDAPITKINKPLNLNCDIFIFCSFYLSVMTTNTVTRVRRKNVITLFIIPGGHHLAG